MKYYTPNKLAWAIHQISIQGFPFKDDEDE